MANIDITNSGELTDILWEFGEKIVNDMSKKARAKLDESIWKNVYTFDYFPNMAYIYPGNSPNEFFPTFQFRKAWRIRESLVQLFAYEKTLEYNPENMEFDPDKGIHGSEEFGDRREYLAEDLNVSGVSPTSAYGNKHRAPYWDMFIEELFDGGGLKQMSDDVAHSLGLI
jgi:hypothetical protein